MSDDLNVGIELELLDEQLVNGRVVVHEQNAGFCELIEVFHRGTEYVDGDGTPAVAGLAGHQHGVMASQQLCRAT
ncbi:MAG: hypothetical protein ABI323_04700 [Solirubrobacteraceae bacterium]